MTPYQIAHQAYHEGWTPEIPWTIAMDFHLQHGLIISNPDFFVMARPVTFGSDLAENSLDRLCPESSHWHVWIFAGNIGSGFNEIQNQIQILSLSWTRFRGGPLRRADYDRLWNRRHLLSCREKIAC